MKRPVALFLAILALSACATVTGGGDNLTLAELGPPQVSDDIMMGGQFREPWLSAAVREAASHPLGSPENPVRSDMPGGERNYLSRLRCADGKAPTFNRIGNLGAGAFGSIVDAYDVRCAGSSPAQSEIIMDMYFSGYREANPAPGFTIAPPS